MYEWTADWLLEQIQGKPFAPKNRPGQRVSGERVMQRKQYLGEAYRFEEDCVFLLRHLEP